MGHLWDSYFNSLYSWIRPGRNMKPMHVHGEYQDNLCRSVFFFHFITLIEGAMGPCFQHFLVPKYNTHLWAAMVFNSRDSRNPHLTGNRTLLGAMVVSWEKEEDGKVTLPKRDSLSDSPYHNSYSRAFGRSHQCAWHAWEVADISRCLTLQVKTVSSGKRPGRGLCFQKYMS